ncbi:PREDICTED: wall-associated receptor kinase 2-like [Tarenaya hassleriana]|uniref:wall-associated receptor kinase 2-like n=1 Tax=Tarenaya hassleriana TaxID=28532 RepID=UPI00053C1ADD|nr:PREDICTED: wall-associated receptor kinase 2-like [Tarenaya hassleriana]XP_010534480.1 PREDICTED: wall-associated receptor kinase 2-like [Tarenaya hassleriana]
MSLNIRALLVILFATVYPVASASNTTFPLAKQGCVETCGNVTIPYPFGTSEGCYYDEQFLITCNHTYDPPLAFLTHSDINVTNIRLDGKLHIMQFIARNCYNQSGSYIYGNIPSLTLAKFIISDTENKFVAVGCDTEASIRGFQKDSDKGYTTGCLSICDDISYVANGSCSGIGCCQTSIAKGVSFFNISLSSYRNHVDVWDFNPCSFAFVVEEKSFNFTSNDLRDLDLIEVIPAVLDWSIGNVPCKEAQENKTSYACRRNSKCTDASNGSGYQCICRDGYEGNPYHPDGCHDIKECENKNLNNCTHVCNELEGGYSCACPKGYHGDGVKGGLGCTRDQSITLQLAIGLGAGIPVVLASMIWMYIGYKKWRIVKLREKFFKENGGLMLQQELSAREASSNRESAKIFSAEELKKATNNYDDSKITGKGGYGTVYKGILADGRVVAIKKSKVIDQSQIEQFINEMLILSQINHRNVVKLLGCCLETEVPLLVYEYITNGTLFDHIHNNKSNVSALNWETRLRIATETAGVLSYLHSSAAIPIIHRDIKSTNILLDDSYTAKVSDFGSSRLVPLDEVALSTMVQGTLGYLDPEYLQTSQLTEKSDVYSFGVLFLELLTGKKAVSFERSEEKRSLAMYFLSALKEDRFLEIIEQCVVKECKAEHLKEVADLAKRCLRVRGDDRPTMKEVAMELEGLLRETGKHPWMMKQERYSEETVYLLGGHMDSAAEFNTGTSSAYDDSMKDGIVLLEVGNGR